MRKMLKISAKTSGISKKHRKLKKPFSIVKFLS